MDEPKISEESEATIKGKDGVMRPTPNPDFSDEDLHDDEETGLTAKERKRKQKKKRRNTMLDQRIARDNISLEERKLADQTVVRKLFVNASLIGLWYLFSLCISLVSIINQPGWVLVGTSFRLTCSTVQQVDVRLQPTQLSLSSIYDLCTHASTVHSCLRGPVLCAIV